MSKVTTKRIVCALFSVIILFIIGIELISNNVIQIMETTEEEREINNISANAPEINETLQAPSKSGYGPVGTITGGSMGGASTSAQYLYAPRNILWRS